MDFSKQNIIKTLLRTFKNEKPIIYSQYSHIYIYIYLIN